MEDKRKLAASCGMYCGVCGVYIAHRDNNIRFKERLRDVYRQGLGDNTIEASDMSCEGCHSDLLSGYCQDCAIRSCTVERGIEGCHQCSDFPCKSIDDFPIPVGKKVILR